MSWTVACFCGRMFSGPATSCPSCGAAVPSVTWRRASDAAAEPLPDAVRRRNAR